jgi:RNA polymerase sigma factor (sigma-70 family)
MSSRNRLTRVIGRRGARLDDIERLYRRRVGAFLASVTAFLGDADAALDAVQDGFVLAIRKRASFRGEADLEAWVWRIVLNAARDRAGIGSRQTALANRVASDDQIRSAVSRNDTHVELRGLVSALPERQRLAVFLRYYADLSYSQLGQVLGVDPGTIAASLNAAHRTLRQQLEEQTELEVAK